MDIPCRKKNRIPDYDYSQSGAYFVTICTQDRTPCLGRICVGDGFPVPKPSVQGKIVESYIAMIEKRYSGVRVDKYVVMPDHIHLILMIDAKLNGTGNPSPTMGQIIGWFKYQTTKACNQLIGTPGVRFWQRSYYDHVIRNEQDYLDVWEYIDNNPTKWWIQHKAKE